MFYLDRNCFKGEILNLPLNNNKKKSTVPGMLGLNLCGLVAGSNWLGFRSRGISFSYPRKFDPWPCLLLLFLLLASSGCEQKSEEVLTLSAQESAREAVNIQKGDITDTSSSKEIFEERRALWVKKKPSHYRLGFAFTCDCHYRTSQLRTVKSGDKVITEHSGNSLTVEVKDGKVVEIRKENGDQVPVKEYRAAQAPSSLVEYVWNVGQSEKEGHKLLSEPTEFLWKKTQEAIQSKPPKTISITYDGQFGFIKKIDFVSSIPDNYFQGEIKGFTSLIR